MRGAQLIVVACADSVGIIPADAGSTLRHQEQDVHGGDHPRGCGEHRIGSWDDRSPLGSSPRMRGAHLRNQVKNLSDRIIPADAGSTTLSASNVAGVRDHPRGCGEHADFDSLYLSPAGSSPRMRGAQQTFRKAVAEVGIIPADAGSTEDSELGITAAEDHPRGCGEHLGAGPLGRSAGGSSPRMRGAQLTGTGLSWSLWIIPADAGSTIQTILFFVESWDHPRGCGEHLLRSALDCLTEGSSPRMRGALRL